jgi:propionyl-CoA carboxylase alpha chain
MSVIAKLLIANRGEIACRIARTCRRLGIGTVAVFSDADADALHVRSCDRAVRLPGTAAADTYLRDDLLVEAARRAGVDAVHPGYGFLAESADFAQRVTKAGLVWVGPPPDAIAAMGSKIEAKGAMRAAGLPVLPDSTAVNDPAEIGYPLLVKASAGGGGRGIRVVAEPGELAQALADAGREAAASFGDGTVFCERYVRAGRHVEIQIVADTHGQVASLHERECSIQRRHQKIVEESPSPAVDAALRERMSTDAITAARAIGYVGAGTVEFLLEPDGRFWFLEMNTRLQVEHPVTELVTGLDLVELQLAVAEGAALPAAALNAPLDGHAIEARLTAEDPAAVYRPSTGTFTRFEIPADAGVRVDSGVETGSRVPPYYDSLVAKVIAHGPTRDATIRALVTALRRSRLEGPTTNRDQLVRVLEHDAFRAGDLHTEFLADHDTTAPLTGPLDVAAAAVALAEIAANRATARVLGAVPAGWRNNRAVVPSIGLRHGDTDVTVRYGYCLGDDPHVEVGFAELAPAELVDLRIGSWTADQVELEVEGVRQLFEIGRDGMRRYVHGPDGQAVFEVLPRFPRPGRGNAAGSLVAPMPGAVLRVAVSAEDAVAAGQILVVIEAMKMEHQIVAPDDGRVAEVLVAPGDQVESGQVLLRLTAE